MLIKYMKNASFLAVFAVCVFGVFISCNNPFSGNLGEKVDVEPPTITVESPAAGAYIQGTAQFTGKATAYRKLNSVKIRTEIRIIENDISKIAWTEWEDITHNNMGNMSGSDKDKTWTYNLDTSGREDGFLKIQFRASDPNLTAESVELVYIIKNSPSAVKLSVPDQNKLDSGEETVRIGTNTEIKGNIIDRRGVKPGYPMIKLWPAAMAEPAGGDPEWGWVSAFISGTDSTPEEGAWAYADRGALPVARAANFTFKLSKYAIDPATRQAVYDLSGGDYLPLDTGLYNFRVITSDSYFYTLEEANADPSATYMHPRGPVAAMGEHGETVGYMPGLDGPVTDPWDGGPFYTVQMVSAGVRPSVELDNSDIGRAELERTPNIYITENTAKKIVAEGPGRADFRLRILAAHPDLIEKATLEWEHAGAAHRSGFLPWDDLAGSDGYVDAGDPAGGHKGLWNNPAKQAEGKLFQFTADCGSLRDGGGNLVFTSSTEPYALKATVYSASGMQAAQKYTLYLDGSGPSVGIRSVRGAASAPAADGYAASGGVINENPYTVNGNIQVSVDRAASMGIAERADGLPAVKWVVEEDRAGYLEAADTVYSKLRAFRRDPSAAGLEFFNGIGESPSSGWVSLPDRGGAAEADRTHNFTFNTFNGSGQGANQWDGKDLWLYVIAQDGIQNLGFAAQKLSVADGSDVPGLEVPGLVSNTEIKDGVQYDSKGKLYIGLTGGLLPSRAKTNVLDRDQGIDLGLNDDDALGDTEIVLKDLNGTAAAEISLGIAAGAREWNGVLTQQMMAAALYAGQEPLPQHLRDGMYELYIRVEDDMAAKVRISRSPPREGDEPKLAWTEKRFYFAVHSQQPQIVIDSPGENSMQTNRPVDIYGKVQSRSRIQRLEVTFTPKLDAGGYNQTDTSFLDLYADEARTGEYKIADPLGVQDAELDLADGVYTYYWKVDRQVNFDPPDLFLGATDAQKFDWRNFNLLAWDGMGESGASSCSVQVDTTPPEIELIAFNYGRLDIDGKNKVNGKVPIEVNAYDLNGIKRDSDDPGARVYIKWFVIASGAPIPDWDDESLLEEGISGWYSYGGANQLGSLYTTVFDSSVLPDGNYSLYIMAEDDAGNRGSMKQNFVFTIDQSTDNPVLRDGTLNPINGDVIGNVAEGTSAGISGTIYDDDGFDGTKANTYVRIRFPNNNIDMNWGSWQDVSGALNLIGDLDFTFDFSAHPYIANDGQKRYQIEVTDEVGNKNPDGINTIESKTVILPGNESYYHFNLKNTPPQIFFKENDPQSGSGHNYSDDRPVFRTMEQLAAALNGGWVVEGMLRDVYFTYGNSSTPHFILNADSEITEEEIAVHGQPSIYEARYYWALDSDWLDSFDSAADGMQSITIRATDVLGNPAIVEWSFYKDTTGPEINFINVSSASAMIISGEAGDVFIKGQFNDDYSHLAGVLEYQFNNNAWTALDIIEYGQLSGKSATWNVPIPGAFNDPVFMDGQHSFRVKTKDIRGNETESPVVNFIVDRKNPQMIAADNMIVKGRTGLVDYDGASINGPLPEHRRVFSASGIVPGSGTGVFTVSGYVYEYNLSELRASIRNTIGVVETITLNDILMWNGTGFWPNAADNFRIRKAVDNDKDVYGNFITEDMAHKYIWELDICEGDLHKLISDATNGVNNDNERRSVTVTARDIARNDSAREVWNFYLDSAQPKLAFLNLKEDGAVNWSDYTLSTATVLDDRDIVLQGIAEDATKIKAIEYKIDKYNYSGAGYETVADWDNYDFGAPSDMVYWNITNNTIFANDGLYRLSMRVTDWSLSDSANAGNLKETLNVEFYIDRAEPVIVWKDTHANFNKWNKDGRLIFNINISDDNTISGVSGKLWAFGDNTRQGASPTAAVVTASPAAPYPNSSDVTITVADPVSKLPNGRYTLVLTVTDRTGREAFVENTVSFYLDNKKPEISVEPAGGNNAVTGRVMFRGSFSKTNPDSPVARVAYAVTVNGIVPPVTDPDGVVLTDSQLAGNGWRFRSDNASLAGNYKLAWDDIDLMEINEGLATANILLYNTRFFNGSNYLGVEKEISVDIPSGTVKFNGTSIPDNEKVTELTIHFLAVDETGNSDTRTETFYIYDAGDEPEVVSINNPNQHDVESNRQLNGRIRISGNAADNYRVQRVWFRVLKDDAKIPAINLSIPEWNDFWAAKEINQTPQDKKGTANHAEIGGWYMANGGGSKNVSWWAFINTEGELDPGDTTSRSIIIEVMAEDTIWIDSMNDGNGGYSDSNNLFSKVNSVNAFVVNGAPRFEDEKVLPSASGEESNYDKWGSILTTYVRGRASYAVTVKHDSGISQIRWTPPSYTSPVNLLDGYPEYNAHILAMAGGSWSAANPGIAATARPKNLIDDGNKGNMAGRTFMIWDADPALLAIDLEGGIKLINEGNYNENQRYTVFTVRSGTAYTPSLGSAKLLEATTETVEGKARRTFEWIVIIDMNTDIAEDGKYKGAAAYLRTELSATEISKTIPLTATKRVEIPVDNIAPRAMYTHSTNIAGSAPTFGGQAGDTGDVQGLSRVVLWFSRAGVNGEESIPWWQQTLQDNGTYVPSGKDFVDGPAAGITLPDGVTMPAIPESDAAEQYSCIVIDRHDPLGNQSHHGHKQGMGFARVGGDLDTAWYVSLDSTRIISGRITAHYIVYDRAGNMQYYNQKLMIMNNVPRISRLTLATEFRPDTALQGTGTGQLDSLNANLKFKDTEGSAIAIIKARVMNRLGLAVEPAASAMGISEPVTVDTTKPGIYSVVYDEQYFNVRNNLFAVKVETIAGSSGKTRNYRVEYVSGAKSISTTLKTEPVIGVITDTSAFSGIKAGRVYVINNHGSNENKFPWGSLGVQVENPVKGTVFLAIEDGNKIEIPQLNYGTPSVWELNSSYYNNNADSLDRNNVPGALALDDVTYNIVEVGNTAGNTAEFVYGAQAFGIAAGSAIRDYAGLRDPVGRPMAYPTSDSLNPWEAHSLFIIRVFDGDEKDLFGDFALLSVRVNNNDTTPPYAQLYDLNPKTEGASSNQTLPAALSAGSAMGQNRTRGGLWNSGTTANVAKGGHIEPRKATSLTSAEMGGAAANPGSITLPFALSEAFFDTDTVSGEVIVRGYAEDDQRVASVDLVFTPVGGAGARTVTILEPRTDLTATLPENSVFLQAAANADAADRVQFFETANLERHRVEWAYYWNTEAVPADYVVGNINVRAVAHNAHTAPAVSVTIPYSAANSAYNYFNPTYPSTGVNVRRYNEVQVNIRPYITGFKRNQEMFAHNTRSRQGRYMFARDESAVVTGFNLGIADGSGTDIFLPAANNATVSANANAVGNADKDSFDLDSDARTRYRVFTVPSASVSGNGLVTLSVTRNSTVYWAVNTGTERPSAAGPVRPQWIQPWNMERNPGTEGSDLWDDFTQAHIWSGGSGSGIDQGQFKKGEGLMTVFDPSMSIDPQTGTLWSSHSEGGGDGHNTGTVKVSNNNDNTPAFIVAKFLDPIISSDIYISPNPSGYTANANNFTVWTSYSIIGKAGGTTNAWKDYGGIYITGPNGGSAGLNSGVGVTTNNGFGAVGDQSARSQYFAESTYYNSRNLAPGTETNPPSVNQFINSHIITHMEGATEHIHVSYYDTKDGSVKYKYNRRSSPGKVDGSTTETANNAATELALNTAPYAWTNLDGGYDNDDQNAFNANDNNGWSTGTGGGWFTTPWSGFTGAIAQNGRIVNYSSRPGVVTSRNNTGRHNAIAVTSHGYPVVAYYDQTAQKLKLAISNSRIPIPANHWRIIDNVIPTDNLSHSGTGEFVSIKIDAVSNTVHIAALNSVNKNLVYIRGSLTGTPNAPSSTSSADGTHYSLDNVTVQVVDSVGSVGRWCNISLDKNGNPWIAYQDESYRGSRDGVKMAYLDTSTFYKGVEGNGSYFGGRDTDIFGNKIGGWEAMHVPTQYRVNDARIGMERFPARSHPDASRGGFNSFAAVGYLAPDLYRIAYYVE